MRHLKLIFLLLFSLLCNNIDAQFFRVPRAYRIYSNNIRAIKDGNVIKGYFLFYMLDKLNYEENEYRLYILNDNLDVSHEIDFEGKKDCQLVSSSFNGTHFCFSLYSAKADIIEYRFYDLQGKFIGAYIDGELKQNQNDFYKTQLTMTGWNSVTVNNLMGKLGKNYNKSFGETIRQEFVFLDDFVPIPGKGFLRYAPGIKKNDNFQLELITNESKLAWSTEFKANETKGYSLLKPLLVTDSIIVSVELKGIETKWKSEIVFHNLGNGKEISRIAGVKGGDFGLMPSSAEYDSIQKQILVFGDYYLLNNEKKINLDRNREGLFRQKFNLRGELLSSNVLSWQKDIAPNVPGEALKGERKLIIHQALTTYDGKSFFIGEVYKRDIDPVFLTGYGSGIKIVLFDIIIFEMDQDFNLNKTYRIEKEKTHVNIPEWFPQLSSTHEAAVLKALNSFDYSYTSIDREKKRFSVVYAYRTRQIGENRKCLIGSVNYKDDTILESRMSLIKEPSWFITFPAKPGYIAIFEYFKGEKDGAFRLEKIDI